MDTKKRIQIYLQIMIVLGSAYLAYLIYSDKRSTEFAHETIISDFETSIGSKCERGEWIAFPKYPNPPEGSEYSATVALKMDGEDAFASEDGSTRFVSDKEYSLSFFNGRSVELSGVTLVSSGRKEIYVERIRCVGAEADPNKQAGRHGLMEYVSANIDTLAPDRSPSGPWQIQTFYFVNDHDFYVEYESEASFEEQASYDGHLWLIRAAQGEGSDPQIETLAYIQLDAEDPEKDVVKIGTDIYENEENLAVYAFDEENNAWILQ